MTSIGSHFVELILNQGVVHNTQPKEAENQIQNASATVSNFTIALLHFGHLFTRFVEPVQQIDGASDNAEQEHHATAGIGGTAAGDIQIVDQTNHPVDAVNPTGDDAQHNAQCNTAVLNRSTVLIPRMKSVLRIIGRIWSLSGAIHTIACIAIIVVWGSLIIPLRITILVLLLCTGLLQRGSAMIAKSCRIRALSTALRAKHHNSPFCFSVGRSVGKPDLLYS